MQHRQRNSREIHFVLEEYMSLHGISDISGVNLDDFVEWARTNHKILPPQVDEHRLIRRQVARALRDTLYQDPQKRLVRRYHHVNEEDPVTHEKIDRVVDITTAPPEQMRFSFGVRREGTFHDVYQLYLDKESYNDNNRFGAKLELDFNYNKDIEERGFPGEYPAEPPDDDDDDDE